MSLLLDTCVISEMIKLKPATVVADWFEKQKSESLFISALTLGELQKGIAKLEQDDRKSFLQKCIQDDVINAFEGRILEVNGKIALLWGDLVAKTEKIGRRMPYIDSLIAATALTHDLTFVTRNTKDVEASGVKLFNPWQEN